MSILYTSEHLTCFNYENAELPSIELRHHPKGEKWERPVKVPSIVFLIEGKLSVSFGDYSVSIVSDGNIFFVSGRETVGCNVLTDSTVIVIRLKSKVSLCECYSIGQLRSDNRGIPYSNQDSHVILSANKVMEDYLQSLKTYIQDGLKCSYLFEAKIREAFFIFRGYYSKDELYALFRPLADSDNEFVRRVIDVVPDCRTVEDLAQKMNYSVPGFIKKFGRIFNESPSKWMRERKAHMIYNELISGSSSFKELSTQFGFSSTTYFNDFCKRIFNKTPGEIRKHPGITHNSEEMDQNSERLSNF